MAGDWLRTEPEAGIQGRDWQPSEGRVEEKPEERGGDQPRTYMQGPGTQTERADGQMNGVGPVEVGKGWREGILGPVEVGKGWGEDICVSQQ